MNNSELVSESLLIFKIDAKDVFGFEDDMDIDLEKVKESLQQR